jgi:hypothetical protein
MTNRYYPTKIFYDCPEYVASRDKLIPEAEDYSNRTAGLRPSPAGGAQSYGGKTEIQKWGDLWSYVFHTRMNELAIREGLCSDLF